MNVKKAIVIFALAAAAFTVSGCPHKKPAPPPPASAHSNKKPKSAAAPSKQLAPDPGDYFPLAARMSWTYRYSECVKLDEARRQKMRGAPKKACQKYEVKTVIAEKREIDGADVFLLCGRNEKIDTEKQKDKICNEPFNGNGKGYMVQGDYVYLVFIKNNHIADKSIAGKRDLKPGDTWERVTFLKNERKTMRLTCAEPEMVTLPSDDPAPAHYKAICCDNAAEKGPRDPDFYIVCYAAGVGRLAEYSPNADQAAELIQAGSAR